MIIILIVLIVSVIIIVFYYFYYVIRQHTMCEFSKDIFDAYLDQAPKYSKLNSFPKRADSESVLSDVEDVTPELDEVQIHHHGNQSAIVIEGRNLWFCYQVSFRGLKVPIPASDISGSSIRYNIKSLKASDQDHKMCETVTLGYYFKSRPIRKSVDVHEKVFEFL